MHLVGIPSEDAMKLWPTLKPYFESFAKRSNGKHSAITLRHALLAKEYQCWVVHSDEGEVFAVVLTEVFKTETGERWGSLGFCAGRKRKEWIHLFDELRQKARDEKLDGFTITCRPGWSRFLAEQGLKKTHHVFEERF